MAKSPDGMMRNFIKPLAWLPVIIINAIIAWSYFAYIVVFCFGTVTNIPERIVYLALYNPIFLIFMVSYWRTIMCTPGGVPHQFHLSLSDKERYDAAENPQAVVDDLAKNLPILTKSINGGARFCEVCQLVKPDRCHHCSMCNCCILKMDHHCPWVNNCVGYGNYKFFFLFLLHGIIYTFFIAVTTLKYFLKFWEAGSPKADSSLHILFLFFISAMFFVSLWSLFGYHIFLMLFNRTTLESFRAPVFGSGPDKDGFNLGKSKNFCQVFGTNRWLWFLPVYTTLGNGHSFPVGASQCPESEGLLHGQALLVCSEQESLLANDVNSPLPDRIVRTDLDLPVMSDDCAESDSEINVTRQKTVDVEIGIGSILAL